MRSFKDISVHLKNAMKQKRIENDNLEVIASFGIMADRVLNKEFYYLLYFLRKGNDFSFDMTCLR